MAVDAERIRALISDQLEKLKAPSDLYRGFANLEIFQSAQNLAKNSSELLQKEFEKDERFLAGDPVLWGSWARDQISPRSDLDLGFWTDTPQTQALIRELQKTPLTLRARILTREDILTWPIPEQLAFLQHKALAAKAEQESSFQKQRLLSAPESEKKKWVKILKEERDQRHRRGFEFENVLEPHIKTGRGGLRDIQQAEHLFALFPKLWTDPHLRSVMSSCLWFLLQIRFELHRLGAGDFLQAQLQIEIAKKLNYPDFKDFMREVQLCLSRVAFYSDFMFENALSSNAVRQKTLERNFQTGEDCVRALKKDPSLLTQYQVRRQMDSLIGPGWIRKNADLIEEYQGFLFSKSTPEKFLRAAFRSRLLDQLDPRLRSLVGYNQHDQYHAFTTETHILNLLLGLKSALRKPRTQGLFAGMIRELSARDESILMWACYYHDLAKGQGGDHEEVGEKWVRQDGRSRERSDVFTDEVAWLVRHHLEFSKAAFREDPRSEKTWQRLFALGLNPGRIRRLSLFTILDIQATHPKAWTPWKEKLLFDLAQNLIHPSRLKILKAKQKIEKEFSFAVFELSFLEAVTPARIARDLRRVKTSKIKLGFRVEKVRGGFWVRYFVKDDAPGILVQALKSLFAAGASVQAAWVHTLPDFGVYDWFFVSSNLNAEVFERRLELLDPQKIKLPQLAWTELQIEKPPGQNHWILHLVGPDQRGLLTGTAEKIQELGGNILAAQIQTWGERAEDRITVQWPKSADSARIENDLRAALLLKK